MLEFVSVHRRFGRSVALDGLTLSVRAGEVLGLLGPNGAGKTTAIGLATGILSADSGVVRVGGLDPRTAEARRLIGLAPQSLALYDALTPLENAVLFGRMYGMGRVEARRAARGLLDRVGLGDRADRAVGGLSGGMKRRVNLAVALVHDPRLVLLDEPTANVDPRSRSEIFEIVRGLRGEGRTVVYSTHYMEEAERLCDRVAVVDAGRVIALGGVEELIASGGGESVIEFERDGEACSVRAADPRAALGALVSEAGVSRLRVRRPDLESVFLRLTGRSLDG